MSDQFKVLDSAFVCSACGGRVYNVGSHNCGPWLAPRIAALEARLSQIEVWHAMASPPALRTTSALCPESSCLNLAACQKAGRCIERTEAVS